MVHYFWIYCLDLPLAAGMDLQNKNSSSDGCSKMEQATHPGVSRACFSINPLFFTSTFGLCRVFIIWHSGKHHPFVQTFREAGKAKAQKLIVKKME